MHKFRNRERWLLKRIGDACTGLWPQRKWTISDELVSDVSDIGNQLHRALARNVKWRFAHAQGMAGTFSSPPGFSDPDMHHGTCVTPVPGCIPGCLTSGFLWSRWRGKHSGTSGACTAHNFTYLVRAPWAIIPWINDMENKCILNWCDLEYLALSGWLRVLYHHTTFEEPLNVITLCLCSE